MTRIHHESTIENRWSEFAADEFYVAGRVRAEESFTIRAIGYEAYTATGACHDRRHAVRALARARAPREVRPAPELAAHVYEVVQRSPNPKERS